MNGNKNDGLLVKNQIVASFVTRVGAINGLDGCSIEIPIANS